MPAPPPPGRPSGPSKKMSSSTSTTTTRVPTMRPGLAGSNSNFSRDRSATPAFNGRSSPADSVASSRQRTPKRKAPTSELDISTEEETNINVVVRCRGRNDREVRENSGVVVSTDGIQGKKVELSMGPSALSNKTYQFDKVFSPAADQGMIFDEVVAPILDNVLSGFNCTIFAYGQTGTGKTYTMSGDIAGILPIPDAAGIIPRVLHSLFDRLGEEQDEKSENNVKCSFIELYNEELRDLLAIDDSVKLKIFDEANKSGRTTTLVQGMEETHIEGAVKGIQLLRRGSHKRQVAATKCNDLSSRSHTVFTITVYMKRTSDTGEELMSAGKLNLVDLAGSENIQRSGAENKRATEAGLINKSLLTLGRVINALVDKSSHIPYRESKLTRLLQDSLGGQTKTCIIATLSPAKSNLEETISTLDYAFRAKNIRNKPQINQMISKKTMIKEFASEIEKLKSELIATRQRNGVYLTQENYEEITTESESRRILSEEQRDRIETMEANLRNKVQELFNLTQNFSILKKDNERARVTLDGTKDLLARTEMVLEHTKQSLAEEAMLRRAHEETEEKLFEVGEDLLGTLGTTTDHMDRLHSKLRRRSDLQTVNRLLWAASQSHVAEATVGVEQRIQDLRHQQQTLVTTLSDRMQAFVRDELQEMQNSRMLLQEKAVAFEKSETEVNQQTGKARDDMNEVLQEIQALREDVKEKVGTGLNELSVAAQHISAGISSELGAFHAQLQASYVSLGKEFKTIFEDLVKRMREQQTENERLRQQIVSANEAFVQAGEASQLELQEAVDQERQIATAERTALLGQITKLVSESAAAQDARMSGYFERTNKRLKTSRDEYRVAQQLYGSGVDILQANAKALIESSVKSRESVKSKLKNDWATANEHTTKITSTTQAVHGETVRIVDGQMAQMDSQLVSLDQIVGRIRQQNNEHHQAHTSSLEQLASNVQQSYQSIGEHFGTSYDRTKSLGEDMEERTHALQSTLPDLDDGGAILKSLSGLRDKIITSQIQEYTITGETPAKTQFSYPSTLPRTEAHDTLLSRMRGIPETINDAAPKSPSKRSPAKRGYSSPTKVLQSPSKQLVWTDTPPSLPPPKEAPDSAPGRHTLAGSDRSSDTTLRDIDVNISTSVPQHNHTMPNIPVSSDNVLGRRAESKVSVAAPKLARHKTDSSVQSHGMESKLPAKKSNRQTFAGLAEGRENLKPDFNASVGPGSGLGRKLRSRGSD